MKGNTEQTVQSHSSLRVSSITLDTRCFPMVKMAIPADTRMVASILLRVKHWFGSDLRVTAPATRALAVQIPGRKEHNTRSNALEQPGPDGTQRSLHRIQGIGVNNMGDDVYERRDKNRQERRVGPSDGFVDQLGAIRN